MRDFPPMRAERSVASPELTGGAGFTFEDRVVAIYLAALLGEAPAPGTPGRYVVGVELQRAAFGQPMDDLVVKAVGQDGTSATLALQVKRALTISAAKTNADFQDIVAMGWATLTGTDFRLGVDRIGAITGSIAQESKRAVETVCEWARLSPTADDFMARFDAGTANETHRRVRDAFAAALKAAHAGANDGDLHRLLASFVLITRDLLHEGSADEAQTVALLKGYLPPQDAARADELFGRLAQLARDAAGRAGQFTRPILLSQLRGRFRFTPAASLHEDLQRLRGEAECALAEIEDGIQGFHVPRDDALAAVQAALKTKRFLQISGLPGVGKSAVLRRMASTAVTAGPAIVLKADRLEGRGWTGYATARGLTCGDLAALMVEIGAAGTPILFIDGLDRVEVEHRAIVNDFLNILDGTPELADWRVVVTVRDNALEPLRTWLSPRWLAGGAAIVEVNPLSDSEAETLAKERPHLRSLLFGSEALRELTRRPFFLSVLARLPDNADLATENDLIEAWWRAGGYNAPPIRAGDRQTALLALAREGAATLGRRMPVRASSPVAIEELRADGILRDLRAGHTVAFNHDIYFEWAFLHLLIEEDEAWPETLRAVGEPPVLGRVVELLSQLYFREPPAWREHLERLEPLGLRSQWTRAWLLGPFASSDFTAHAGQMTDAAFSGGNPRLSKLTVWFQAEKTTPNPVIITQAAKIADVQLTIRMADQLAWPSDFRAWGRFIDWLLVHQEEIPHDTFSVALSVFEVWQNALSDLRNPRSTALLDLAQSWLYQVEELRHLKDYRSREWGAWGDIWDELSGLEKRLRKLLLRAANAYPERLDAYLDRVTTNRKLGNESLEEVIAYSRALVDVMPAKLVDYTLAEILDELPEDRQARIQREREFHYRLPDHDSEDWHQLAIRREYRVFVSASPAMQPFASLFEVVPDEGRRLVRSICNHAINAWRQLCRLSTRRPLPLVLDFPWGAQTFWGDEQVYLWFRAIWGPSVAQAGLMALEKWALDELEGGRPLDDVMREVVEGHDSCAVLGVAVSLLLQSQTATPAGVPLIGSARLWDYDLRRWQQERDPHPNLITFSISPGNEAHKAVLAGNALPFRRWNLRDLTILFVLSSNEVIRKASRDAIQTFESNPPIDDEADLEDEAKLAAARRIGAIWSKLGDKSTYEARRTPDGEAIELRHQSPHAEDADVQAVAKRAHRQNDAASLVLWANDSFETRAISNQSPLAEALERARGFDSPDLFEKAREIGLGSTVQSGVVGIAAAALTYAELDADTETWARITVFRAAKTLEPVDVPFIAQSLVPDHPCIFAARGLAAIIASTRDAEHARELLLVLAAHPLHAVASAAISAAVNNWPVDRQLAWAILDMGIHLSIGQRRPDEHWMQGDDREARRATAIGTAKAACKRLESSKINVRLSSLPPAWTQKPGKRWVTGRHRRTLSLETEWREPDTFLRLEFLGKVLAVLPVEQILADADYRDTFLSFCDELLSWTIQRLKPPWVQEGAAERHNGRSTELLEWRRALSRFLARVGLYLPADEVHARFLAPLFALDDDLALSFISSFVGFTSTAGLMDPPEIASSVLPSLNACLERVLSARTWASARRNDGDLHGYELVRIVRDLTCVAHVDCKLSSRFANGDWSQLHLIFPMVVRLVYAVGDVPIVADAFLTLCERALPFIPTATFADLALSMVTAHGPPAGWRGSSLPGRLATTIQAAAEQAHPMPLDEAQKMLRTLDCLVDMGDRRSAALQLSEFFKDVQIDAQTA